ncbi:hypothetical protein E3O53_07555 [Cryobacterium sp. TMT2-18-3]|uniref:hypothetical protein n=1 Tax=unclassified Cryobacterium TaxID=2649013 RepID=UPI00106B298C|nr:MULTISPECIES: hypothetical protein [unclassified Cryobacterium]TFC32044.1 hypothetical protein E3O22_01170 [Cryobacterium sp. TMT2-18-2]TFC39792.1 hypothetical protein E3O18_01075 [Cryobacterium sp. TMT2-42-4]TFC64937.1 hypothetical protein E3O53_07555 [Cryobacterium sp. TMT2-18-3]
MLSSAAGGRLLGPIGHILAASALGIFSRQSLRPLVPSASATDLDVMRELIDPDTVAPGSR